MEKEGKPFLPKPGVNGKYPKGLVAAALQTSYGEIPWPKQASAISLAYAMHIMR